MALEGGSMLGDADGMGDILSLALEQSGFGLDPFVPTTFPPTADMTPMSGPLLSNDINAFTDSLFSGFTPVPTSTVINPSYMPSSGPEMAFFLQPNIPQPQLNFGQPQGPSTTDDLATLLETTSADYLQSISDDFQSLPPPQSIPHVSPMVPPHSLPLTHPPIHSDPLSSLGPMDVDDVLLELGLDDPTFSSISQPPPAPPPQITSSPFPMGSVTRMIGSVSVTPLNNGGKLHIHVNNGQRLTTPKAQVANTLPPPPQPQADEELEDEDDQFVAADTYATYKPAKLNTGYSHPDPIVESSSLASVEPPQVWFDLKFPEMVIEEVRLSSLQLEAVVYACQQHMNLLADGSRAGFLIGDGAGVGKGRTVAGIIYQNYIEGRKKALWLSVSNDLKYDAIRDLHDVGAKKINVYALNKFHYGKISGKRNGRVKKGVIFATYSSLIGESSSGGKYRTRFNQLFHWLGPHFDGVIVFDECHKAKNLVPSGAGKPSKTGITVLQLQKKLPKARIVYCSATGASEPKNMAYMSRLGIWGLGTQFGTFQDFIKSVERRGVGAMELVAMDMKLRGLYIARQLSFTGVTFSVEEISLSPEFITMYDKSVAFWVEARRLFKEAADLLDYDSKGLKTVWGQFWAAHQRFFKYLCIAAKVPSTIELAKKALKDGKCVVIGLQSTGEARTLEQLGQNQGELDGFVSTAKGVLESLIKRHFPTPSVGGINWDIFNNDPTLPQSCRKRKRGQVGLGEFPSSEESSSGWENSDSAVESSDDDEEEMKEGDEEDSDDSESDSNGDKKDFSGLFGPDEPNWLEKSKPKTKKRKISPSSRGRGRHQRGNYSIKPPITSASNGQAGELKFNYKTLEFERVTNSRPNKPIERRQSMPVTNGHKSFDRQLSQQPGSSQSLLEVMSSSALTTGSQSGLRHVTVHKMKDELFRKLEELAPLLPTNSLDQLIEGLGGPTKVSEMTGRRGRIVTMSDGSVRYQLRTEADVSIEMLNITEKQRFMDGDKNVAIISEAASSGISLQADRRAKNQKRRVHITLELPWSADKAIQQFGRTHRSNQINAPEYVFLISTLSGEHRFASIVAKRLESLGALTHGDRRATESRDLSRYNIDTKYGRQALEVSMRSLVGLNTPIISSPKYNQEFIDNARVAMTNVDLLSYDRAGQRTVDKESLNMSRFLNRLLGLPVELQNLVFSYLTDTLEEIIRRAKRAGRWDGGILDFGASGEHVELVESKEYVGDAAFGTATTQLHKVLVERGISFTEALNKLNTDYLPGEGFYISNKPRNDKHLAVMLKISKEGSDAYLVHRPNTGVQARPEELKSLKKKYTMSTPEEAEKWWTLQYDTTLGSCNHSYWQGKCRLSTPSHPCDIGIRRKTYYILTGSLLGVWTHLEGIFIRHPSHAHKMQIVRVHTPGRKLVGILIPAVCVVDLNTTLEKIALQAAGSADNAIDVS